MERIKIAVIFDHRNRTEDGKEGPLEVRATVGKKPYYINTGVRVRRSEWAGSVINRPDADALNERLGLIIRRVSEEVNAMQRDDIPVDVQTVKARVFAEREDEASDALLRWLEKEVPLLKVKPGTRKRYDVLLGRLAQFGGIKRWRDLTVENLYAFDRWLHNIERPQSNGDRQASAEKVKIGDAAVYNYHKTLRSMLNRAVKFGIIEVNPYDRVRGEFSKGEGENVEYLTEEEVECIESLRPMAGTQMAMARDLFVFQLYTGLSYSDAQAFDISGYRKVNGRWRAVGNRIKTGVPYVSDLLPQAVEVLEHYGMQVPKVGNAQYNESLKFIQKALGIRTRLHSHLARHTFATRALAAGAKIENVSRMLGHTSTKQTEHYAKVLAESVHDDFDNLAMRLGRKKNDTVAG